MFRSVDELCVAVAIAVVALAYGILPVMLEAAEGPRPAHGPALSLQYSPVPAAMAADR